ncbi:MAG: hypothetical protein MUF34_37580, partial [Polyangiaceae bacterium]|nr:hypothetical protein [Polyangiaceae bacterium]
MNVAAALQVRVEEREEARRTAQDLWALATLFRGAWAVLDSRYSSAFSSNNGTAAGPRPDRPDARRRRAPVRDEIHFHGPSKRFIPVGERADRDAFAQQRGGGCPPACPPQRGGACR